MIKNLVITPVVIGRISIGERVESNGRQLPKKSDEFHLTTNVQANGEWQVPPVPEAQKKEGSKLRSIPVRVMFDSPENNFRAGYACFNNEGRQVCAGDGEKATRRTPAGSADVECPGHDTCAFGKNNRCKPYGRLMVALESLHEKDPLAAFAFRTTGYNSVNALTSRLAAFNAMTGGRMAGMACNLVLRAKSTAQSRRQAIYYVDIEPRGTIFSAISEARQWQEKCAKQGIDLAALDEAVAAGFNASQYIDSEEAAIEDDVAGEFYQHEHQEHQDRQDRQEHPANPLDEIRQAAEREGPSKEFMEVMTKIDTITNPSSGASAKIWINNKRDLSESEKAAAHKKLDDRIAALQTAEQRLAA